MFALNRLSLATQDPTHHQRAISLAKASHPNFFINRQSANRKMVWKLSMDMSKPLVWSQGNLDPLDGFKVFRQLQAASGDPDTLKMSLPTTSASLISNASTQSARIRLILA